MDIQINVHQEGHQATAALEASREPVFEQDVDMYLEAAHTGSGGA